MDMISLTNLSGGEQRIPESKQTAGLLSLQMDYQIQENFLVHLQIDLLKSTSKTYDPLFEDDFLLYRDSLAVAGKGLPWVQDEYGYSDLSYLNFPFSPNGASISNYSKTQETNRSISGYVQKRIGKHEITFGAVRHQRTIRNFEIRDLNRFMQNLPSGENDNPERDLNDQLQLRELGIVWSYGYDLFGNKIEVADDVNDKPRQPKHYSIFVENRLISGKYQVGIGVRYDSFSNDALIYKDPLSPGFSGNNIALSSMKISPRHSYYSPRFNAQFQANSQLRLEFRFGKYVQPIQYRNVYMSRGMAYSSIYGYGYYEYQLNPRAFDAKPVITTQTEFQIQYDFSQRLLANVSLFHKFSEGQLQVDRIDGAVEYLILSNAGESVSNGLELSLNYVNKSFKALLNYTYTDLKGFQSYPLSNLVDYFYGTGEESDTGNPYTPLDYNQPHRGQVMLSYSFGNSKSIVIKNLSFQTLLRFNSGHSYTLYQARDTFG